MFRFGIYTQEQYARLGAGRQFSGSRVAYNLLKLPDTPTPDDIRIFEDISFTLQTTNGTFRTTFRDRFRDIDALSLKLLETRSREAPLEVQDRAASHALTAWEWAEALFQVFPNTEFIASDILLFLVELALETGETYIVEPNGRPLQYIKPPFVLSLLLEPRRYPVNCWMARRARRRFDRLGLPENWMETDSGPGYRVTKISYIHPSAVAFGKRNPRFQVRVQSVFDATPQACDVLRTMNIFNASYFPAEQISKGFAAVFESLRPGGMWIMGRTLEEDFSNHVTFFERQERGWRVRERIGQGSDLESLALAQRA